MEFAVGDWVVCPGLGIGQVASLVTRSFSEAEGQLYYEVSGAASTVWVQVASRPGQGLRRLTRQAELAQFRSILRGVPRTLDANFRQRQLDVRAQLRLGTLQALCELVRDLHGRAWRKPLTETEIEALRKSSEALCLEWAAADGTTLAAATGEINDLLSAARREHLA